MSWSWLLYKEKAKVTSDFWREVSAWTLLLFEDLVSKEAGLIYVARGTGGAELAKAADESSLLDIYQQ